MRATSLAQSCGRRGHRSTAAAVDADAAARHVADAWQVPGRVRLEVSRSQAQFPLERHDTTRHDLSVFFPLGIVGDVANLLTASAVGVPSRHLTTLIIHWQSTDGWRWKVLILASSYLMLDAFCRAWLRCHVDDGILRGWRNIREIENTSGYFHSVMPDLKVSDKVRFENFIRMSWDDFEQLFAVEEPMVVKKSTIFRSV